MNRGAFAAITRDGKVLLVRALTAPKFSNHWSLPGGIVEVGESLKAAARREAIEETGIVCQVEQLLAEVVNPESNITVSIFKASYVSGEIVIDDVEIAEAKWLTIADALGLPLAYNTRDILLAL